MTGLNKDKDKDKRSGEARVSDVFDCIFILLHIANIFDGSSLANVSDWWYYYCFDLVPIIIIVTKYHVFNFKQGPLRLSS